MLILLLLSGIIGSAIKFRVLYKKLEKAQLEVVDLKYDIEAAAELEKQKRFNTKIDTIIKIVTVKEKEIDEIKKDINTPTANFDDASIQDSINSEFNRRFP